MKFLTLLGATLVVMQCAHAQSHGANFDACDYQALAGGSACLGNETIIVAGSPDAPLSEAAVELRNPIAPQSNYTAKTIEDDEVFAAQVVLRKNGCYDGRLDGVLADGTVYAIKLFEANMGLVPTGTIGPETEAALRQNHDRFDICR